MERGLGWTVEARRKGRGEEQEQWRQGEQGQEQRKQGKEVRFGEEEQLEETRAESTNELKETDGVTEVRTGRGSAGLVRGGDERCQVTRPAGKAKEKVTEERVSMKAKEEPEVKEQSSGAEWRLTWGQVAHTPRPRRTREKKKRKNEGKGHEGRDGQTVKTTKERRKKNRRQKEKDRKSQKERRSTRQGKRQGKRS